MDKGLARGAPECYETRVSPNVELELSRVIAAQHGLITRAQAVAAGASTDSIDRRCGRGAWVRVAPAVYRVASAESSWEQDVMLAILSVAVEAVASHQTAAILWQLTDQDRYPIHIVTSRPRWKARAFQVHRSTDLAEPYVTIYSGIPVTTPTRTIIDVAATSPAWRAERVLDTALRKGLTSLDELAEIVSDLARQGRRGVKLVRELIDARADWIGVTESELEDQFRRLLNELDLPLPLTQYEVSDNGGFVARVDFAYPDQEVAIELDGFAFHTDPASFTLDRERQNRLLMAGFRVLRYTARDLRSRPKQVAQELQRALAFPVNRDRARRG